MSFGGRSSILKGQAVGRRVNPMSGAQRAGVRGMMGRKSQSSWAGSLGKGLSHSLQTTALSLPYSFVWIYSSKCCFKFFLKKEILLTSSRLSILIFTFMVPKMEPGGRCKEIKLYKNTSRGIMERIQEGKQLCLAIEKEG